MRATSIGHAGILVDTSAGSILCDPWFVPAFFGSWFVFPRNDQLPAGLLERIEHPTYLYISHLHGDHLDESWLAEHVDRDVTVLLPGYPTRELERKLRSFGFSNFVRTHDGEPVQLGSDLEIAIHVETSITDGPGGDSALVVDDGTAVLVNQNDCRTSDLQALRHHGSVDLHWLQYSGAIWYPMVYDETPQRMRQLVDAKVDSQLTRAMRYVEAIDARAVVPSAGPPAFLDPELFGFNMVTGDELSIFPDQRVFMDRLASVGRTGVLAIPGTEIEVRDGEITTTHPMAEADVAAIFSDKAGYLRSYQADWLPWLDELHANWHRPTADLLSTLQEWWVPLLAMAPTLRAGVGQACLLRAGDDSILIDFPNGEVRAHAGEPYGFSFQFQRELVETVTADLAVDWSNALFLSCRFKAWRAGSYNEYLYNFFKSLSPERMRRAESEAKHKLDPEQRGIAAEEIRLGDYIVERTCPHRHADLTVFGEVEGCELVCTLHGWRFDLETGKCLTSDDRALRVRRAAPED
ncbi:MAG: Rieske 2Fe-2S domain-containing protein [Ilumatobacteraceae bacterium]